MYDKQYLLSLLLFPPKPYASIRLIEEYNPLNLPYVDLMKGVSDLTLELLGISRFRENKLCIQKK